MKKMCHHFHLSLQSGCTETLKRMNRKYTAEEFIEIVDRIRSVYSDAVLTTDIIVGFPEESREDFAASCEFAEKAGFLMIHVFPYSKRKGTVAASMKGQVAESLKHERVAILSDISRRIRGRILDSEIARCEEKEVLFETFKDGYATGHTSDFIEVRVKTEKDIRSLLRNVRLVSHNGDICDGILIE
jgi:threonylcarbamoyladenosine tRNA methylthiotransferase MtaB